MVVNVEMPTTGGDLDLSPVSPPRPTYLIPKPILPVGSKPPAMAECDQCGREENLPYKCRHCGGVYCGDHRLPENHGCPGLEQWDQPSGVFDSGFDDTVQDDRGDSPSVAERLGVSTGTGGLLAYFRGNLTYTFLALMWATFFVQVVIYPLLGHPTPTIHQDSPVWSATFTLSSENPEYVWTWVTSIFAHGSFLHIVGNSIVLYFFGPIVERRLGTKKFAIFFIVTGVVAGWAQIGSVYVMEFLAMNPEPSSVLGASGAILGIMGVLTVLNPHLRVYLYFILPIPLWVLTIGFAAFSVFMVAAGDPGAGGIAHLAHLVGLFIGLAYGEKLRRENVAAPEQLQFGGGPGGPGGGGQRRRGRI